jgi:hypothetical protein
MRWGDDTLSVTGEWWVEDPSESVPGFLEEVPGRGLVLTVLGKISEPFPKKPIPEVYGSALSGVVLSDVAMAAGERTGSDVQRQEFDVESALLGTKTPPSGLSVVAGKVKFTGLHDWRPGNALHIGYEGLDDVTATFTSPPVESAAISGGDISLGVGNRVHSGIGEIAIEAIPSFHITLDESIGYDEFLSEWIAPLRDLNSLVTSHRSAIVHLEFSPPNHDGLPIDVRGGPVEWDSRVRPPAMTALDLDLLRPSESVGIEFPPPADMSFQELLESWWSFYARQSLALGQYFSSYYNSPPPENVRLLNHLVVLETFHHHKFPDVTKEPPEEFMNRRKRILDPKSWGGRNGDRTWLRDQSWNLMNSLSLKERLQSLAKLTSPLGKVVEDWEQCCQQLADTRNYLAHGKADLEERAIPPSEYGAVIRLLDSWIRALFWTELGFRDSMIKGMLMRVESFAWLRANIGQPWIRSDPEDDLFPL